MVNSFIDHFFLLTFLFEHFRDYGPIRGLSLGFNKDHSSFAPCAWSWIDAKVSHLLNSWMSRAILFFAPISSDTEAIRAFLASMILVTLRSLIVFQITVRAFTIFGSFAAM